MRERNQNTYDVLPHNSIPSFFFKNQCQYPSQSHNGKVGRKNKDSNLIVVKDEDNGFWGFFNCQGYICLLLSIKNMGVTTINPIINHSNFV